MNTEIQGIDVLASIHPWYTFKIFSHEKFDEIRKSRPKISTPFRVLVYCTNPKSNVGFWMPKPGYPDDHASCYLSICKRWQFDQLGNGFVVGEFICDAITEHVWHEDDSPINPIYEPYFMKAYYTPDVSEERSCLKRSEIEEYGDGKKLYSWHIKDAKLYDKPVPISNFKVEHRTKAWITQEPLKRPPQSWCYVINTERESTLTKKDDLA